MSVNCVLMQKQTPTDSVAVASREGNLQVGIELSHALVDFLIIHFNYRVLMHNIVMLIVMSF